MENDPSGATGERTGFRRGVNVNHKMYVSSKYKHNRERVQRLKHIQSKLKIMAAFGDTARHSPGTGPGRFWRWPEFAPCTASGRTRACGRWRPRPARRRGSSTKAAGRRCPSRGPASKNNGKSLLVQNRTLYPNGVSFLGWEILGKSWLADSRVALKDDDNNWNEFFGTFFGVIFGTCEGWMSVNFNFQRNYGKRWNFFLSHIVGIPELENIQNAFHSLKINRRLTVELYWFNNAEKSGIKHVQ